MNKATTVNERVRGRLKELHLTAIRNYFEEAATTAQQEQLSYEQYLLEVLEHESEVRLARRIGRLLQQSHLPLGKTLEAFDMTRLPAGIARQVRTLADGAFLDRRENVLAFGNPGSGKTHLLCAIAHELVQAGRRVYFTPTSLLVQELLLAKRELTLGRLLKKLGRFEAVILDDLGYVQQSREEMEVLFTLLAERYERGSVMITSNLPFSKWEEIFKDPMTTAAAIDRLVHHSVILELNITSYRMEAAKSRKTRRKKRASK
jgi:DNA replication protein DnaC